ncbi:MAG: opioid growth factor receptor-related protein [Pseudanabaenaceae cyanobacterium bins.39]|nr:opioid growth factor receptor-related protein [Pseudanabaenaceae cyanobacterium bins.39]
MNHNHLRITRILRSLSLLGLKAYAKAFLACLKELDQENPKAIAPQTMEFWENAV